jgi:riboflavin kinase/FMN adenylyltransferase
MQHLRALETLHLSGAWVTIGSFDGVHRGHQVVLNRLVAGAHAAGRQAVVVTFFPHPVAVLRGLNGPFYLTSPEERANQMAELGVDVVITLPFTRELAARTASQFMQDLANSLGLEKLVLGYDFALGRGREGDVPALRRLGESMGYTVDVLDPAGSGGLPVSSTRIRELLNQGQVGEAAALLGRWYALIGKINHGDGRGRQIGIPTANLSTWTDQIIPPRGVYATLAWLHNQAYPAVTNIGVRPTFEVHTTQARVEAHILDFNEDLYGLEMRLEFVKFLRPEQRFSSVHDLIDQIHLDIQAAREVLPYVP